MSLLRRAFDPQASFQEVATSADLARLLGVVESDSGAIVNSETAMRFAAVYSCVRVISEDISSLPLPLYRRLERGKERVTDHWLVELLKRPNAWQTGLEFRQLLQSHVELVGNGFALKTIVRGEILELLPLAPNRVTVKQLPDFRVVYEVTLPDRAPMTVPADRMLHLQGFSLDGLVGLSPVGYQRETIGLGIQLVKFGARLFKQGAALKGVLEHPGRLTKEAADRIRQSFDEIYAGVDNAHRTAVLEEGLKFAKTGMNADDAQFLESRKMTRSEIAGLYRVPPHLIGDLERATFSNIEHQGIQYVKGAILPRTKRVEERLWLSLVPEAEKADLFFEHNIDGLLRGDFPARMNGYRTAVLTGFLSRNEVREMENRNPEDGLDEFLSPLNMEDPARGDGEAAGQEGGQEGGAGDDEPPKRKRKPKEDE